jgi:hypothetical protein
MRTIPHTDPIPSTWGAMEIENMESNSVSFDRASTDRAEDAKVVKISGFVYQMDIGGGEPDYAFFSSDCQGDRWYTLIGPAEFTYEIPAGFNPVARKLATLEAEKQKVRAAFAAKVAEIDEAIGKLQALEWVEA